MNKKKRNVNWKKGAEAAVGGSNFFRPKPGMNYVKLIEPYYTHGYTHWLDSEEGNRIRINCLASYENRSNIEADCPLCKAKAAGEAIDTSHKYFFNVIVGTVRILKNGKRMIIFEPESQVMEVGSKIGGTICSFGDEISEDPDGEWSGLGIRDITQVIFKITRTGEKLATLYSTRIMNTKNFKINGELNETTITDLDELIKKPDMALALKVLGSNGNEDEYKDDDEEDDGDLGFNSEKPKKKNDKKKHIEKEDEEDFNFDEDELDEEDEDEEVIKLSKKQSRKKKYSDDEDE